MKFNQWAIGAKGEFRIPILAERGQLDDAIEEYAQYVAAEKSGTSTADPIVCMRTNTAMTDLELKWPFISGANVPDPDGLCPEPAEYILACMKKWREDPAFVLNLLTWVKAQKPPSQSGTEQT